MRSGVLWCVSNGLPKYLGSFRRRVVTQKRKPDIELRARANTRIRVKGHQLAHGFFPASYLLEQVDQFPSSPRALRQSVRGPILVYSTLVVVDGSGGLV